MIAQSLQWKNDALEILDQRQLPQRIRYLRCHSYPSVIKAIDELAVRGAPAIGIVAAYGVYLGIKNMQTKERFLTEFPLVVEKFKASRPTAVNLFWALGRMEKIVKRREKSLAELKKELLDEALIIHNEEKEKCEKIARYGAKLIKDGFTVLTHCNTGMLATGGIGTALGIIYKAKQEGKRISVIVTETRPLLQGARLTTWELKQTDIEVTLICDSAAAWTMKNKKIDCLIVGADRIAGNGDIANKIGTYNLAILARTHKIPFYVAAPTSTFDWNLKNGKEIPIETRNAEEITFTPLEKFSKGAGVKRKKITPDGINVFNPAFDVTPAKFISAIITEEGILRPTSGHFLLDKVFRMV
ncbi:MAG: S-methyl-5-thioribose-1-phosphate isomerase [Candidatus Edwardsbacteria bacterium]